MARTEYSQNLVGDNIARGKANEIPVSPKHAIEIATFARGRKADDVIDYLNRVVAGEKALPFRRFRRDIAHKRGMESGCSGRYPKKASIAFISLLNSVKKNAEYTGLDPEKLLIVHAAANRGRGQKAFFPRAMGRATPKRRETVNIEIIVREVE